MLRAFSIINILAAFVGNMVNVAVAKPKNECQQNVNDFVCCILYNTWAMLRLLPMIDILAACVGYIVNVVVVTPENERQQSVNDFRYCIVDNARAQLLP
jgi:hypothetical protein